MRQMILSAEVDMPEELVGDLVLVSAPVAPRTLAPAPVGPSPLTPRCEHHYQCRLATTITFINRLQQEC